MANPIDLRQLAIQRNSPAAKAPGRRSRRFGTRYALPGVVFLGFFAVIGWAVRDRYLPSRQVTVVPVLATTSEIRNEGTPLFQAAGWVEPRPSANLVTALAEGTVDKLFVVEGQRVKAGDVIAQLNPADAEFALHAAEADLELRKSELSVAHAAVKAARANFERPVHLQAAFGEAEALAAQKETELASLPFQTTVAKARLELARRTYEGKQTAAGAVPPIQLQQAKSELDSSQAAYAEIANRDSLLKREVVAHRLKRDAVQHRLVLKTEEIRHLAETEANVKGCEARCRQVQAALDGARLRLQRMTVRAPVDGQVLALPARPGMRVMGLSPWTLHDSSTVASLYDPASLQVRADVRLEDVPRVQSGQKVKIETAAAPGGALDGEVLQATSQADIQKNTLQVKVGLKSPPSSVRPDMLVQVTFLAPPSPKNTDAGNQPLRYLIPRSLVETGESGARVWIADRAGNVARARSVTLGQTSGDLIEVVGGLNLADRVISGGREGLIDGQRITVVGEDLGAGAGPGGVGPTPKSPATGTSKNSNAKK
ncbi:MAG: efflux RND transporter periplasmic adaptor subunit [Gemmataceae bacterium]|nr:efflux RND transporter periplasmic adaptor subunit [Gemmataceae bacterium]